MRLLFARFNCYLDPSSGAALCTRELLELLAGREMDCRVLSARALDPERETSLDEVLPALELPIRRFEAELGTGSAAEVIDLSVNGVRVTLMAKSCSRAERSPDPRESAIFLELAEQVFDRFRPDVVLTYGSHPASLELMRRARQRGIAVVFHLHNFGYNDRRGFADDSAVIFPSEYSRRHHAGLLGLDGPVTPDPIPLDRIFAADLEPKYITFINPQPSKGMAVFARIAVVLNEHRLDIPLLVVEGRGPADALTRLLPVDISDVRFPSSLPLPCPVFPPVFSPSRIRTGQGLSDSPERLQLDIREHRSVHCTGHLD